MRTAHTKLPVSGGTVRGTQNSLCLKAPYSLRMQNFWCLRASCLERRAFIGACVASIRVLAIADLLNTSQGTASYRVGRWASLDFERSAWAA